ncbi:efflux transporter periplasmic adaptor subunit, partial [Paraburkholderia azotifigens]
MGRRFGHPSMVAAWPLATRFAFAAMLASVLFLTACKKAPTEPPRPTVEVTVVTVEQKETPVDFEFTAQTQSSR